MKQDDEKNWDRRGFPQWMASVGTQMSFHDINHPIAIRDVPLEDDMVTAGAGAKELHSSQDDRTGRGGVSAMRNIRWGGAAMTVVLMALGTAAADRPVHEIEVTASRYAFEPATIQVNAGEPVRIVIRSADGVHGFAIPALKVDAPVPKGGDAVKVEFTAPPAGLYEIACSEFCGRGHGQMKAALISVGPTQTSR